MIPFKNSSRLRAIFAALRAQGKLQYQKHPRVSRPKSSLQKPTATDTIPENDRRKMVDDLATLFNYPKEKIAVINRDAGMFGVGRASYEEAAHAELGTGKIILYNGAFKSPHNPEVFLRGTLAHEVMHQKFQTVVNKGMDIGKDPRYVDKKTHDVTDEARKKYSNIVMMSDLLFGKSLKDLQKEDGVSEYSTSFWLASKESKVDIASAVHETLAEMSRTLSAPTMIHSGDKEAGPTFKKLYQLIHAAYDAKEHEK